MTGTHPSTVAVCFWYDGDAEAAARFYVSLLPNSAVTGVSPLMVTFTLDGCAFQGLNGGPMYRPNEAASISVRTETQAETDRLWDALTADGGEPGRCGWLKDRWGVSWQIVPSRLGELLGHADRAGAKRAMDAMLKMNKLVIDELEAAFRGESLKP